MKNINPNSATVLTAVTALTAAPALVSCDQSPKLSELGKPNVVWYMTEDTSPQYYGLYNDGRGAESPRLEALARESITYNNAFSNAPVSSAARTTLITGCFAPRFGGSLHRHMELMEMPEGLNMFPTYLREAGYFTCNAMKTDYNVTLDPEAWDNIKGDVGSWREREDPTQPFFYVRTNMVTHESRLLFGEDTYRNVETRTNPDSVYLHPYIPDTELVRYTYATLYDRIKDSDDEFGQILDMLKEDNLLDNTFVFYFGDNGGSIPGTKGYTDNIGLRVPLVVYVPEKWRVALGVEAGECRDGFVSFMDFGATILNLAGVKLPEQMDGVPFLGKGSKPGTESKICYGDRFDDLYSFNRVIYKGKYRYARNYQPYQTQGLFSFYRYKSLAFQQWRDMFRAGELNKAQASFFEPFGAEELYDQEVDPNELNNLAQDAAYVSVLNDMRGELAGYVARYCDIGFYPETVILEQGKAGAAEFGAAHKSDIMKYKAVADLQMLSYEDAEDDLERAIESDDEVEQWWALTSGAWFGAAALSDDDFMEEVEELTESDERSYLRMRANLLLIKSGEKSIEESEIKDMLRRSKTTAETLMVLNDLAYLYEGGLLPKLHLVVEDTPFHDENVEERIKYLNL